MAADLQLAAANRSTDLVEYLSGPPFIDGLTSESWSIDAEEMLPIPEGMTLDMDAVVKYTGAWCEQD